MTKEDLEKILKWLEWSRMQKKDGPVPEASEEEWRQEIDLQKRILEDHRREQAPDDVIKRSQGMIRSLRRRLRYGIERGWITKDSTMLSKYIDR